MILHNMTTHIHKEAIINLGFFRMCTVLKTKGVEIFAFAGTALGLHRYGRILKGDKDADFYIRNSSHEEVISMLRAENFPAARSPMGYGICSFTNRFKADLFFKSDVLGGAVLYQTEWDKRKDYVVDTLVNSNIVECKTPFGVSLPINDRAVDTFKGLYPEGTKVDWRVPINPAPDPIENKDYSHLLNQPIHIFGTFDTMDSKDFELINYARSLSKEVWVWVYKKSQHPNHNEWNNMSKFWMLGINVEFLKEPVFNKQQGYILMSAENQEEADSFSAKWFPNHVGKVYWTNTLK